MKKKFELTPKMVETLKKEESVIVKGGKTYNGNDFNVICPGKMKLDVKCKSEKK